MLNLAPYEEIDYLVIGHIACDIIPNGFRIGGTAAYSALTAAALGMRVGIVTAWGGEISLAQLGAIPVASYPCEASTQFENIYTPDGRIQTIRSIAPTLDYHMIPEPWRAAPIVHLGPIAQEVEPSLVRLFPESMVALTPQGWLRAWDKKGHVHPCEWPEASFMLENASTASLSVEDVGRDEALIMEMAEHCRILAVTEAHQGCQLYWNGDVRRFRPPAMVEIDATGAGDIFAAAFFTRLHLTQDPWEAARFATQIAAYSVARVGLESIPTHQEIQESLVEVL